MWLVASYHGCLWSMTLVTANGLMFVTLVPVSLVSLLAYAAVALVPLAVLVRLARPDGAVRAWMTLGFLAGSASISFSLSARGRVEAAVSALDWSAWGASVSSAVHDPVLGSTVVGPIAEEVGKAFCVLAILAIGRATLDRPVDGILVGASVGSGFQFVENLLNTFEFSSMDLRSPDGGVLLTTGIRSIGLFCSHWVLAAVVGAGLWAAFAPRSRHRGRGGLLLLALSMALAVGLHSAWNTIVAHTTGRLEALPFFVALCMAGVLVMVLAIGWARREGARSAVAAHGPPTAPRLPAR